MVKKQPRNTEAGSSATERAATRMASAAGRQSARQAKARISGGSPIVGFMRVVLPAMALTMIGLLAAWPVLTAPQIESTLRDFGRNEVINARYLSRNEDNRPFQLTSETAVQMASDKSLVDMVHPAAEFSQEGGGWLAIDAEQGWYNRDTGMLDLYRNVHFLRDDGVELFTSVATVNTRDGSVRSDVPVSGIGPSGEISAEGFRMYDYGERIVFLNGSEAGVAMKKFGGT